MTVASTPGSAGVVRRWRDRLPLDAKVEAVDLGEGSTPLIRLDRLGARLGRDLTVYAKFEGMNPTGSFKDRGMAVAISQARYEGVRAVVCASTGNTSAAAAAYAHRAGLDCYVLIPEGRIARGKLAQAQMHGAMIVQFAGNFDQGMAAVRGLSKELGLAIVNSINPYRLEGQKTAAFEIVEVLGCAPDHHCLPVGNAGNISAYWMGYRQSLERGDIAAAPVMCGYQAAGAAPFVHGAPIDNPDTLATAICIGKPQSWELALDAQRSSGGWFAAVSDQQILAAQKLLAESDGIFCEPASAASIAGLIEDVESGKIRAGSTVVCTLTGHGLKDPDVVDAQELAAAAPRLSRHQRARRRHPQSRRLSRFGPCFKAARGRQGAERRRARAQPEAAGARANRGRQPLRALLQRPEKPQLRAVL